MSYAPVSDTIKVKHVVSEDTHQEIIRDTIAVPTAKPDIEEVVSVYKSVNVDRTRLIEDKVIVEGTLRFQIVYVADTPEGDQPVHHTHGEIPFTSYVELPGAEPGMNVIVNVEIEDVKVKRQNGRTFKVTAVLAVSAKVTDTIEIEVLTDIPDCTVDSEKIRVNHVIGSDSTQTVIDDTFLIPEEKPNAEKILDVVDEDVVITNTRVLDGKVIIDGELMLQVLYVSAEDPSQPVHHVHTEFPFSTFVEIPGATSDYNVEVESEIESAEVMLSGDDENGARELTAYVILKLDVTVTKSKVIDIISFVHDCTYRSVVLHLESVVGEDSRQAVVRDTFTPPGEKPPAEKILDTTVSETVINEKRILDDKVVVAGTINVNVIYVGATVAGDQPVHSVHRELNFRTFLEIPGAEEDMDVQVRVMVEYIKASLANGDIHIEAVLKVTARVIETIRKEVCVSADVVLPGEDTDHKDGKYPDHDKRCPQGTFAYTIRSGDTFFVLAQQFNTTIEAIQRANPGVDPNNLQIGQVICIPSDGDGRCPQGTFAYTIRSGDTFFFLAQRFNTTVEAIQRANPGVNPNNLQIGQVICIPSGGDDRCPQGTSAYAIRSGDTFFSLAQRFNTTVEAIQRANPGVDPNNLQIGQVICIPSGGDDRCPRGTFAYTIRSGDTFFSLARRFNTTVEAIQRANPGVDPNNLQIGQVICIPN